MTPSMRMSAVALVLLLILTGCGSAQPGRYGGAGMRMMIPNSPGGGYDITARTAIHIMEDTGITGDVDTFNVTGAGGSVAIARLMNETGNQNLMMMMGLGVVGSGYANGSKIRVADTTPLAELLEEQEGILVPARSPYATIGDLITAWKTAPALVTVGGGSAAGGPDHLVPMELARTLGISVRSVTYQPYAGGGELLPALLEKKISFGVSGLAEYADQISSGQLRVLAVSGKRRLSKIDAPTLRESGIDLAFTNWRGVLAPPGISEATRSHLINELTKLHDSPAWKEALFENGWDDAFNTGDSFSEFLRQQDVHVAATLEELGLP